MIICQKKKTSNKSMGYPINATESDYDTDNDNCQTDNYYLLITTKQIINE